MKPHDDPNLELLYQHYRATVDRHQQDVKSRDRHLLMAVSVVILLFTQVFFPGTSKSLISGLLGQFLNFPTNTEFQGAETGLLLVHVLITVRYFQKCIRVERGYPYIHYLEEHLCTETQTEYFTAEGKSYLDNYPHYLNALHFVYNGVIPLVFVVVAGIQIYLQFPFVSEPEDLLRVVNIAFALIAMLFVALYWCYAFPKSVGRFCDNVLAKLGRKDQAPTT